MAFSVTHQRVQHYDDIVEYMSRDAIAKYKRETGLNPTTQQIAFLKKELIRYAVIRHDLKTATAITINKSNILNETYNIPSRNGQQRQSI